VLLVVAVLAITVGSVLLGWEEGVSIDALERTIRSWGGWGVAASIGLMVVHSFVPFPAEFVAVANGMVYGPVWGVIVTWSGAMLGGFLAFGLARALGRPFAEAMIARRNWHVLDQWTTSHGGRLLLFSRFPPVIAFNLINYAAGLTRISWWTFAWATGIGILPMTILMVALGDAIEFLTWETWLLAGIAAVVSWLVLGRKLAAIRGSSDGSGRGKKTS